MENINLNLIPSGKPPVCHASQYDKLRSIRVNLFDGVTPYAIANGDTFELCVRKPDNTVVTVNVLVNAGLTYCIIYTSPQITAVKGVNICELKITNGGKIIGTLNFDMAVEGDPLDAGINSESVIRDLQAQVNADTLNALTTLGVFNSDNGIVTVTNPTVTAHESGKYVNLNGGISPFVAASYSEIIPVKKDDLIVATLEANSLMSAIAYCDETGENRVSAVAGDAYEVKDYTLTSDRDGYIILSYYTDYTHTCTISHKEFKAVKEELAGIEDTLENLEPVTTVTIVDKEQGKYIGTSSIGTFAPAAYSEPIPVKKGDIIKCRMIANVAMMAISYCTVDLNTLFIDRQVQGRSYNIEDYTLVSEHTGYIVLCYYYESPHSCQIISNPIEELQNENILRDKFIVWVGDSLCRGNAFNDSNHGWAGRVADLDGARFMNYAVGGATICNNVPGGSTPTVYSQIESAKTENPDADYIIFEGGCNDADLIGDARGDTKPAQFGSFTENDFSGVYDTDTFCGAFETICMNLSKYWLGKHVGYIVPHKQGVATYYDAENNNRRYYYETAMQICRKWGIPVINLWDGCYLNPKHHWMCDTDNEMTPAEIYAAGYLYADRQHLTKEGYNFEGTLVSDWIKSL